MTVTMLSDAQKSLMRVLHLFCVWGPVITDFSLNVNSDVRVIIVMFILKCNIYIFIPIYLIFNATMLALSVLYGPTALFPELPLFYFAATFKHLNVLDLSRALQQLSGGPSGGLSHLSVSTLPCCTLMEQLLDACPSLLSLSVEIDPVCSRRHTWHQLCRKSASTQKPPGWALIYLNF